MNDLNKLLVQVFKFGIVGLIATVIDWAIYYVLFNFLNINPLSANIGAFAVSVVFNYITSIKWVFDVSGNVSKKKIFTEFIVLSIAGLLITEIIIYVGVDIFKFNPMIVKVVATMVTMVFNFITRKIFLER